MVLEQRETSKEDTLIDQILEDPEALNGSKNASQLDLQQRAMCFKTPTHRREKSLNLQSNTVDSGNGSPYNGNKDI